LISALPSLSTWPGCDPGETGNEIRLAIPADIRRLYLGCVRTSIVQLL